MIEHGRPTQGMEIAVGVEAELRGMASGCCRAVMKRASPASILAIAQEVCAG
jgi:hypothetical protein